MGDVTQILDAIERGDTAAAEGLFPLHRLVPGRVLRPVHPQRVHVAEPAGARRDALHGTPLEVQEADQDLHDRVIGTLEEALGLAGKGIGWVLPA